jgi:hypothetical protein
MTRWLWIFAVLAVVGVVVNDTSRGQVPTAQAPRDLGPGEQGATLRLPGMDPGPAPGKPVVPPNLQGLWNPSASPYPAALHAGAAKVALPPSNPVNINKDIEITPEAGQWMIFVMAYTGPKAPEMARKFVAVMRGHYKWNAYVFNYGAAEKRKEYERVQKIRQEQSDALKKEGLKADIPIRVAAIRIDEQTGVLIGGYKTPDEAMNALKKLRMLDAKDLVGKVDLDTVHVAPVEENNLAKGVKVTDSDSAYVNPFNKAFPARNPTLPKETPGSTTEADLKFLRKINAGEPLSLLQCKKSWTLVIGQFNMQYKTFDDAREAKGFLERFNKGFLLKGGAWEDMTAHNAHNVAEGLRKGGLEAYVLHAKYCSYVTVGGFDKVENDPQLTAMQRWLETRLSSDAYRRPELFPHPMPMAVPR